MRRLTAAVAALAAVGALVGAGCATDRRDEDCDLKTVGLAAVVAGKGGGKGGRNGGERKPPADMRKPAPRASAPAGKAPAPGRKHTGKHRSSDDCDDLPGGDW